jgi:serine/threonine protein phosphatase 1
MTYVISDIHGCYDKYMRMLEKIGFTNNDFLYVLGDVIDRGLQPIEVLQDMSRRTNILPIMGNHEYLAYSVLSKIIMLEATSENIESLLTTKKAKKLFGTQTVIDGFAEILQLWKDDGGLTTMRGFDNLDATMQAKMLKYIGKFLLTPVATTEVNNKKFILTHAGLPEGAIESNIYSYNAQSFAMAQTDYTRKYFDDIYLVTGHTPTFFIDKAYRGKIYRKHNHIAIDTGAVFAKKDGVLACICLETMEEFYVV